VSELVAGTAAGLGGRCSEEVGSTQTFCRWRSTLPGNSLGAARESLRELFRPDVDELEGMLNRIFPRGSEAKCYGLVVPL